MAYVMPIKYITITASVVWIDLNDKHWNKRWNKRSLLISFATKLVIEDVFALIVIILLLSVLLCSTPYHHHYYTCHLHCRPICSIQSPYNQQVIISSNQCALLSFTVKPFKLLLRLFMLLAFYYTIYYTVYSF